jgi:tellurite resistance protein
MSAPRIPLNIFGMGFGLAGLATAWRVAANHGLVPGSISTALMIVAAVVWLATCALYGRYIATSPGAFTRDLQDMTAGPFASLALITPMLLAANGIVPYSQQLAAVFVDVFVVGVVLLGGWFTGMWMRGGTELDRLHPGYFLPTVAGGLLASASAADVGQQLLAQAMLGMGLICWVIVGSMILGRLIFRPRLPDALVPTMAIEVAPAAVASLAYFAINGGRLDLFTAILAGYALLMVVAQLPLLPRYLRLHFSLGTWAFAFSWAAVASTALYWIGFGDFAGAQAFSYLVLAAITIGIGGIAIRTAVAVGRRQLLPPTLKQPSPQRTAGTMEAEPVPSLSH